MFGVSVLLLAAALFSLGLGAVLSLAVRLAGRCESDQRSFLATSADEMYGVLLTFGRGYVFGFEVFLFCWRWTLPTFALGALLYAFGL